MASPDSSNASPLAQGQRIQADFLPEPATIKNVDSRSGYTKVEVVLEESQTFYTKNLRPNQVAQVEVLDAQPEILSGDPTAFFLNIEAHRIRLAHQFDPRLAVSVSQVDPLPHQIEAVYRHALQMPRMRFLIADDAGAGKTIMAGLILKEMQQRGLVERVLVVAPGHLKYQWQREMKERFNTPFKLVNRQVIRASWGENVWQEHPRAIASIDFLKQDDIKATLRSARWDLVIVDEAHKMSAYVYETKDGEKIEKTQRYRTGEVLSEQSEHALFLSATPHKGDEDNFRLFLDLLRPGFFANKELLEESVERGENPLFIRRLKEDMKTFDGEPLFPPRHVKTTPFELTDEEMRLYNEVTSYIKNYYDQAKEKRHIAFAMVILQRRLTSSVHAILSSLERRQTKLQQYLKYPDKIAQHEEEYREVANLDEEEIADLSEEERDEVERKLEEMTIARNIDDVEREVRELEGLIEQAERVKSQEIESKLRTLRDDILDQLGDRKLLIFTEHKDTLWYLEEKLKAWGYSVTLIHGGMHLDARIDAEEEFKHQSQIMVATEAAGEGINLQFCSLMVNYDIPWNPNRLEQRMGRIHRYGQNREVYIWNLIAENTREGQILDKLFKKLDRMRKALGTDRVFDIIGDVIPGTSLNDLLKEAILDQRQMEDIEFDIERVDEEATRETLERVFMSSLATEHIDYTGLLKDQLKAKENRLVPEYVRDYFLRAFDHVGGDFTAIDHGFRVSSVPYALRQRNEDTGFTTRYGKVQPSYSKITFSKEVAQRKNGFEYVAPGHPLLEALTDHILTTTTDKQTHAVFFDPEQKRQGVIWFVEGIVRDGTGSEAGRRVFAVLQKPDGSLQKLNPAVLWDVEPAPDADLPDAIRNLTTGHDDIEDYLMADVLFPYQDEIEARRENDARIKERYGLRSLEYLISESNDKLFEYEHRAEQGEDMRIATQNEKRNRDKLEARREALKEEIRLERNVTVDAPRILGVAAVIADPSAVSYSDDPPSGLVSEDESPGMARDDEIEAVGMRVATNYEEAHGWTVDDVSGEDHGGFDLRSIRYNDDGALGAVRYVEVKARSRTGKIRLTSNEWKKARHFGDEYWLYVVTQAATDDPELTRIQNPAARFSEGENIFATGYIIDQDAWQSRASEGR